MSVVRGAPELPPLGGIAPIGVMGIIGMAPLPACCVAACDCAVLVPCAAEVLVFTGSYAPAAGVLRPLVSVCVFRPVTEWPVVGAGGGAAGVPPVVVPAGTTPGRNEVPF